MIDTCPSCGLDTGGTDICPHCGTARHSPRLPLTALKIGAVVLAAVGLIGLYAAARDLGVPEVTIAEIGATMNLAYVRVAGVVTRQPTYDPESQSLFFRLDDGTGEIGVAAYRAETQALVQNGSVPMLGDRVTVEGTLRVREDFNTLTINAPERIVVERPPATQVAIGQIRPDDANTRVTIAGLVSRLRKPYPGLLVYTIQDNSGAIDLTVGAEVAALTGPLPEIHEGEYAQVTGVVSLYRDTPQLTLTTSADLAPIPDPAAIAEERATGSLTEADENRLVKLTGVLGAAEPFSAGVQFDLDDGSGAVTLLLWQDIFEALDAEAPLIAGLRVRAVGRARFYRGEVQVIPETADGLTVLGLAEALPPTTPTPEADAVATPLVMPEGVTAIGEVQVGDQPTVQGLIIGVESYAGGFKFRLNDGTGSIILLLPEEIYRTLPALDTLRPGATVRATGAVQLYQGDFEIVPASSADVTILSPGSPTAAEATPLGRLSLGDLNRVLTVEGTIAEVERFSRGWRWILDDGTGTVILLLWQNVYNYVPNAAAAAPGMKVRATGVLNEFRGDLEIIPQLGFDVVLNP